MMAFENRGVMLDASRLLEKKSYYYSLLPWLKKWAYNILHFHFADDNGCAIVMPSHPTLAKDAAFTVEEITDFIRVAGEHGLTVIPELECLGHTKFITTAPGYEHLGGSSADTSGFNSLNPELDGTRVILTELLKDVADIFPSDIIHVGLDEVDMSGIEAYKGLSRDDQWKPLAAHAAWVHEEVRRLGKRPGMWGDHILKTPAMLTEFKRLQTELVPDEELVRTKSHLSGNLLLGLETSSSLAVFYGTQEVLKREVTSPEELLIGINAVTAEEIQAVAKELFKSESLNMVLIGPQKEEGEFKELLRSF